MKHGLYAAAIALIGAPAFAGGLDQPVEAAPVAPVAPVAMAPSTDWTGFYVGAQAGILNSTTSGAADLEGDGGIYGLHAGYNYDLGNWVVGGEIDADFGEIDLDGAAEIERVVRLKGKAGYDLGNFLVYGTAGIAQATASGAVESGSGPFGGIGASFRVTDSIVAGGEVLYHQFDDFDDSGIDVTATTATVRVSFQF